MPRRKEVTIESLNLRWRDDGSIDSPRLAELPRPMAYEVGRVLLTLAEQHLDAGQAAYGAANRIEPLPVVEIARMARISIPYARAALRDLRPTGCVVQERACLGRRREYARWAQGSLLAPEQLVHGPARRPRLCELALIVDESIECGDYLDVLLRRAGLLAAQAVSPEEALRLLDRIGFELVIADTRTIVRRASQAAFSRTLAAAGCGPLVQMTRREDGQQKTQLPGARMALQKPFSAQQFEIALTAIGVGQVAEVISGPAAQHDSA